MKKNPTASEMAALRWANTTREQRRDHAKAMAKKRWDNRKAKRVKSPIDKIQPQA